MSTSTEAHLSHKKIVLLKPLIAFNSIINVNILCLTASLEIENLVVRRELADQSEETGDLGGGP